MKKPRKPSLGLCAGCGRDSRAYLCSDCTGSHHEVRTGIQPLDPLEDDYGEDSDADSVCHDWEDGSLWTEGPRNDKRWNGNLMR